MLLYLVVFWRVGRLVPRARNLEEALIAAGVLGMLLTQVATNVGMNLGIAPTVGIPLPFMTYGGSNTITNLTAIGLVLAVGVRVVREQAFVSDWQARPRQQQPASIETTSDTV